jgi:Flp pilus assembly protein CpaB
MNAKAIIPLVAGLGVAGLAAKLGIDYVRKAQGSQTKTVQLWTVTSDVSRGSTVGEESLVPLKFPAEAVPPNAIADKTKIVGRVPHTGVSAGVPILESMLLPAGTKAGIHVPAGLRAVAVKIDESSGVDNHLQPGCRVDVVGYFTVKNGSKNETKARTIIEDVEVAAVGQRIAPDVPASASKDDPKAKGKSAPKQEKPARATTLLVKPEQVPTLLLAEQRGQIKLSMRNNDSTSAAEASNLSEVNENEVLGMHPPTDAAKDSEKAAAPGLGDLVAGLFGPKKPAGGEPAPEIVEAPAAVGPRIAATMVIIQGSERKVVGWAEGRPNETIELTNEGPNIFQDDSSRKPGRKPTKYEQRDKPKPSQQDGGSVTGEKQPVEKLPTRPPPPSTEEEAEPETEAKERIG